MELTVGAAATADGLVAPDAPLPRGRRTRRPVTAAARLPRLRRPRAEPAPLPPGAPRRASASSSPISRSPRGSAGSPACATRSTPGLPGARAPLEWEQRKHERLLRRTDANERNHGDDEAIRREGPGARPRGRPPHPVGRPADAGAGRDPRAVRARAAARRLPDLGVPARDDGDREPRADAEGGRRRRGAVRLEPALDAGRRRRGARRGVRHRSSSRSRARTTTPTTRTSRPRSTTSRS